MSSKTKYAYRFFYNPISPFTFDVSPPPSHFSLLPFTFHLSLINSSLLHNLPGHARPHFLQVADREVPVNGKGVTRTDIFAVNDCPVRRFDFGFYIDPFHGLAHKLKDKGTASVAFENC